MTEEKIHTICEKYGIKNYTINDDMSIDVNDNVVLYDRKLYKLPLKFNKVSGWFNCNNNQLTTLKGSPIEVGSYFDCGNNRLISLKDCPIKVSGNFWCQNNNITSLEDGPIFIGGVFSCYNNLIYEEFKTEFKNDYNLYRKYLKREKLLKSIIND